MTQAGRTEAVPGDITDALNRVVRRARTVMAFRGSAAVLAVGGASLLIIMGVDRWVVTFTAAGRWIMMFSALGVTAGVAYWLLVRPLARSFTHTEIARLVELHHPEFQERISSTVELLTTSDSPELRGSAALIAATTVGAISDARSIRASREISFRIARKFLVAAVSVIGVLVILLAGWPEATWSQFQRSLIPTSNIQRVSSNSLKIKVVTNESVRKASGAFDFAMLRGSQLAVEAEIDNESLNSADFRVSADADGQDDIRRMDKMSDPRQGWRRFRIGFAAEDGDFKFRVAGGDAVSRYYNIRVIEQPKVSKITVGVAPPRHTALEPVIRVLKEDQSPKAMVGSTVTITAELNRPVDVVKAIVDGKSVPVKTDENNSSTFEIQLTKPGVVRWEVNARDKFGFESKSQGRTIYALADQSPTVSMKIPYDDKINNAQGQGLGQGQGKPAQGGGQGKASSGGELSTSELDAKIRWDKTLNNWATFNSKLDDRVLQGAGANVPQQYRQLVRQYFQALSKQGMTPEDRSGKTE